MLLKKARRGCLGLVGAARLAKREHAGRGTFLHELPSGIGLGLLIEQVDGPGWLTRLKRIMGLPEQACFRLQRAWPGAVRRGRRTRLAGRRPRRPGVWSRC